MHQKNGKFHVELSFWPYNILNSFPGKVCVLLDNHLHRIKLGLEFSTGLTFVAPSPVRTSDGIIVVD